MNTLLALTSAAVLLTFTACAPQKPSLINYTCDNGKVLSTQILNDDRIAVGYEGKIIPMERRMAASGSRYVGEGQQWWSKGNEGKFQPLQADENYATQAGLTCSEAISPATL